jgi:hypothetical protein
VQSGNRPRQGEPHASDVLAESRVRARRLVSRRPCGARRAPERGPAGGLHQDHRALAARLPGDGEGRADRPDEGRNRALRGGHTAEGAAPQPGDPRGQPLPRHAGRPRGHAHPARAAQPGRAVDRPHGLLRSPRLRRGDGGPARHRPLARLPRPPRAQRRRRPEADRRVGRLAAVVERQSRHDRALLRGIDAGRRGRAAAQGARDHRAERGTRVDVRPPVPGRCPVLPPVGRADGGVRAACARAQAPRRGRLRQQHGGHGLRPAPVVAVRRRGPAVGRLSGLARRA